MFRDKFFIIFVAVLSVSGIACADESEDSFYLSVFSGIAFQESQEGDFFGEEQTLTFNNGPIFGGSVGYKFREGSYSGFRLELEVSYRDNDTTSRLAPLVTGTGGTSSLGALANFLYDFDHISKHFSPYIGVGIGVGRVKADAFISLDNADQLLFGVETSNAELLLQAIAGINVPLNKDFDLFIDGRYFSAPGGNSIPNLAVFDFTGEATPAFGPSGNYNQFQLQAGLRFHF